MTLPIVENNTRIKISAIEFIKIWRGDYIDNPNYKSFYRRVSMHLWQLEDDPNGTEFVVTFRNFEVDNDIYLSNPKYKFHYLVLDNTKASIFHLIGVTSQSITITNNSNTGGFWLENCKINGFKIENNSKTGYFSINNQSMVGNFLITNKSTTDGFFIDGKSNVGNFRIENSTIASLSINNSTIGNFNMLNNDPFVITSISILDSTTGYFVFRHLVSSSITISYSSIDKLYLKECNISSISINFAEIPSFSINENTFIEHFQYLPQSGSIPQLSIKDSSFGHLDFKDSIFPEFSLLQITDCYVNKLSLIALCNFGSIFFNNLKPLESYHGFKKNEHNQNYVTNERQYEFEQVNIKTCIRIQNADLGKMQFINCDLNAFTYFEYANAKMLDVFVAASQMPNESKFLIPSEQYNLNEQKRLAYAQFKKIYENRGDTISSIRYQASELEAYRVLLSQERESKTYRYSQFWWRNLGESIALYLNRYSSNYGNDWHLGVFITLLWTAICFSIYCYLIGFRPGTNIKMFWELCGYGLQYLNPLRDSDSSPFNDSIVKELRDYPISIGAGARIWDYFSRIIVAYFVYQTIQAFRKFGKSNG